MPAFPVTVAHPIGVDDSFTAGSLAEVADVDHPSAQLG
jgi:hypothetical protein